MLTLIPQVALEDYDSDVDPRLAKLATLHSVCGLNISCDASFWEWEGGAPPKPRYKGVTRVELYSYRTVELPRTVEL